MPSSKNFNATEKVVCVCGASYSKANKAAHMKTKKHINKMNPVVQPKKTIVKPAEKSIDIMLKLLPTLSPQDREILLNALKDEPVAEKDDEDEPVAENKKHDLYLELIDRDFVNEDEIEIYLDQHTVHGDKLSDDDKDFMRGEMLRMLEDNESRF